MTPRRAICGVRAIVIGSMLPCLAACGDEQLVIIEPPLDPLLEIQGTIDASGADVGLYYRSLAPGDDSLTIDADVRMHAASTMKVPVMMQLMLDDADGTLSLDDSIVVYNSFTSIADGSPYDIPRTADSDGVFWDQTGSSVSIRYAIDRMIQYSSNLATNILVDLADPARIRATMAVVGADSMDVLRGVQDLPAFNAGLSNTTTARSLGAVMVAVAESGLFQQTHRDEMVSILEGQQFRDGIPKGLPVGTRVANKTGWITGISHDAAIVYPPTGAPYVLVVMVRGHPAADQGEAMTAHISSLVWTLHSIN
ncbi:MAG: class A beta-lactamase-related serine hydrolase [Gemmatimonadota bacterium]|nr:class A beta-lactamase-related serine hydrolase [Gemmatimonadota bacterium]MDE3005507.1 class A beta-lactamase-related serine hydrolase [Gemmatimonadota bacterium]MDE3012695.1 class A beta-lactamase-related serine hydrolase [Gemmatimonadota bacterium]